MRVLNLVNARANRTREVGCGGQYHDKNGEQKELAEQKAILGFAHSRILPAAGPFAKSNLLAGMPLGCIWAAAAIFTGQFWARRFRELSELRLQTSPLGPYAFLPTSLQSTNGLH
jgi:hypothetical protein